MIPTIGDHWHVWHPVTYGPDDIGMTGTRYECSECPKHLMLVPGSLKNLVMAKARKERHAARREEP